MEKENKETIEIPFGAKDSELNKFEYTIPEGYDARIEDGKVIVQKMESEDEKIRKVLLRCCDDWEKGQFGCMAKEDVPAIRAYLEKQKEQKPVISDEAIRDGVVHFGITSYQIDNWLKKHINVVGQKPAEWSEEDEEWYMYLLGELNASIKDYCGAAEKDIKEAIRWFKSRYKSLRPQPKQEWGDEDEKILRTIISDGSRGVELDSKQIAWLKSLRPQPKQEWSEEDEKMLNGIIERGNSEIPKGECGLTPNQVAWLETRLK